MPAMPGMAAHGGPHVGIQLLPEWLALIWAATFAAVAVSHLRHMAHCTGQRRPWHACHVLMGIGMAFMYLPASIDPVTVPGAFWRVIFACAGLLAATWSIAGVGRAATIIWLLTSMDLAAMLYMWSGNYSSATVAFSVAVGVYLIAEAAVWALDLYRRLDGTIPLVTWRLLPGAEGATMVRATGASAVSATLLGELDISVSMVAMTLGMAYMVAAMQLMS